MITILASVLTTMLFTALFMALFMAGASMQESYEQANYRQVGMLFLIGIPIGVADGYFLSLMITWIVVSNMDYMIWIMSVL